MENYSGYRRLITLGNGLQVMFRLLNSHDKDGLVQMFQEVPEEDLRFLKQDVKDVELVSSWVNHIDFGSVLPILAIEVNTKRVIGDATLHKGKDSSRHVGEVRIFISRPLRNQGLGSLMLEELIGMAQKEGLHWLRAEVLADHTKVLKAFREKGFEAKATLDDYFIRKDGITHDVVLMIRPVLTREESRF